MKNTKMKKPYDEMNADELAVATSDLDREFIAETARPLNARERAQHVRAAARGRGRPPVGKGAARINISIERGLLKKADAVARREKVSRSELIGRAIRGLFDRKAG
jgi:hypothetical protein